MSKGYKQAKPQQSCTPTVGRPPVVARTWTREASRDADTATRAKEQSVRRRCLLRRANPGQKERGLSHPKPLTVRLKPQSLKCSQHRKARLREACTLSNVLSIRQLRPRFLRRCHRCANGDLSWELTFVSRDAHVTANGVPTQPAVLVVPFKLHVILPPAKPVPISISRQIPAFFGNSPVHCHSASIANGEHLNQPAALAWTNSSGLVDRPLAATDCRGGNGSALPQPAD